MDLLRVSQQNINDLLAFTHANPNLSKEKIGELLNHLTNELQQNHRKILEAGNISEIIRKKILLVSSEYHMQIADEEFKDEDLEDVVDEDEEELKDESVN